jgi:glycosyltransferase involved in cell wall biosynthesis
MQPQKRITMTSAPSVAFIHDWLVSYGGAERVLEALLAIYPGSPVYTLVYRPQALGHSPIRQAAVQPSGISRWPFAGRLYRNYLPFMPMAVEQFDLRAYDIVISLSHAVAHGVLTGPHQLHLSYILSPARFAWHLYQQYLEEYRLQRGVRAWIARPLLHWFRLWDHAASSRVDQYVAISHWIADAVRRAYRREADVIYPPVDVERFRPGARREDYYITVARLVANKRLDLIVEACTALGRRLLVVGEGPERRRLEALAGPSVEIAGWLDDDRLPDLLGRARAFIHAADEDFGIAPLEAQAAGCPVIALGRAASLETVVEGRTGLFYAEPSVEALTSAIIRFEQGPQSYDAQTLHDHASQFGVERFEDEFRSCLESAWQGFRAKRPR